MSTDDPRDRAAGWQVGAVIPAADDLRDAAPTLAEVVAEVVADNARLRQALIEVMAWIDGWEPNFIHTRQWPATAQAARAALATAAKEPTQERRE